MANSTQRQIDRFKAASSEEILNLLIQEEELVLNSVVACNELIQIKIYDLPILSLKALIAALPNYDLSACIWNEVAWSRLIINLMYQEAQRRRFQPQDWYYLLDQNQKGPISRAELEVLLANKNQSIEWGRHNIRVNMICPGYVKTKLSAGILENEVSKNGFLKNVSLGRGSTPDEMAGLAVFLASDASSYMTGTSIVNDGGLMNAPLIPMQ